MAQMKIWIKSLILHLCIACNQTTHAKQCGLKKTHSDILMKASFIFSHGDSILGVVTTKNDVEFLLYVKAYMYGHISMH